MNGNDILIQPAKSPRKITHLWDEAHLCMVCGLPEQVVINSDMLDECFGFCDFKGPGNCAGKRAATVGVHVAIYPGLHISKRYGKKPLLAFIMDVRACRECFNLLHPVDVMPDTVWDQYAPMAERAGFGVKPIRHLTEIKPVDAMHPAYVQLRASYKTSPPKAAQPEGEAGDGKQPH